MLDKELHAEKVTILSRLIKESSLTLEEALLLLREGEEEKEQKEQAPKDKATREKEAHQREQEARQKVARERAEREASRSDKER